MTRGSTGCVPPAGTNSGASSLSCLRRADPVRPIVRRFDPCQRRSPARARVGARRIVPLLYFKKELSSYGSS
jgi:hypothetical protein